MLTRATEAAMVIALIATATTANSEVITRCGESSGWAYYFEGGLVGPGQGGWREDGISGGSIEVHLVDERPDIVFYDSTGGPYSHADDGAQVYVSSFQETYDDGRAFTLVADNRQGGLLETYLFAVNASGSGTVVWSAVRNDGFLPKASLMTAACVPG